ncbi:hypothetical protein J2853_005252 [Streptosporangium lutulentum]|uniref:Uncharacterized protein n=1 Tax=Streptosporangium lutulentum TaxID=1461250 RepID=A0ABT9QGZ9_9ACTN|nr:hypothetical protein [Streptosporangium lutulentum]
MSDKGFHGRARWIWVIIMLGFIAVATLELLGVRPE